MSVSHFRLPCGKNGCACVNRLFWIAIIIVELVLVYVLWRPVRDRFNPHRRAAVNTPALRSSENRSFEIHLPDKRQPEIRQPQAKQPQVSQPAAKQQEARQPAKPLPAAHQEVQSGQWHGGAKLAAPISCAIIESMAARARMMPRLDGVCISRLSLATIGLPILAMIK